MHPRRFRLGVGVITASLLALGGVTTIAPTSAGAAGPYTAYVGNDQCPTNNSVTSITGPSSWTVGSTIGVGNCPAGIAFSPDGSTAYMANASDNTITPINTSTFTAGTAFSSGVSTPLYMAVTPNGASLVVTGPGSNQVAVISTANTASVQTVTVGTDPVGVAILPDSSAAYVDNDGLGFRLPLLVISAYAKHGYVSHVHYEHGSILRFVEDQFGLARLGASDTRANSLQPDCFDFTQPPRKFKKIKAAYGQLYFANQPLDARPPDTE